jgi:two-component system, LytTR family, response regulator
MNKIRAIIIDDDKYIRIRLRDQLDAFASMLEVIADYAHPEEALLNIGQLQPDLLFLDIQMPGMTGFELLDKLHTNAFQVIFITSFDQYAIKAIRYSALDYLLKPIDDRELAAAIARCMVEERNISSGRLENLRHNLSLENAGQERIIIPFRSGEKQIQLSEIICLEADSNYTWIRLKGEGRLLTSKTLKDYESVLDESLFIRPNRSHLVNRQFISGWNQDGQPALELTDQSIIPVSRRRMNEIRQVLGD